MKRFRTWIIGGLILLLLLGAALPAAVASVSPGKAYLVGLRDGATASALMGAGFDVRQSWPGLKAAQATVESVGLSNLRAHPAVTYVEEDQTISARNHDGNDVDKGELSWGVQTIHAPDAWKLGSTGKGIKVCVLDSGIDLNHPESQ